MELKTWLIDQIAMETGLSIENVGLDQPFENFELDSLSIVSITFEMEKAFQFKNLDPAIFSEFNTINKLSTWLENQ